MKHDTLAFIDENGKIQPKMKLIKLIRTLREIMRYFAKRMHTKSTCDVIIKPRSESFLPSIAMQIHMLILSRLWHCHRHMAVQTYCILLICSAPFCFSCADFPIAWLNNIDDIAETRMNV